MHFLTLQEEIHKRWQNTKLVVLFYDQFEDNNIKAFDEKLIAELQKEKWHHCCANERFDRKIPNRRLFYI